MRHDVKMLCYVFCSFHKKTFLCCTKAWDITWSDLRVFVQLWNFWMSVYLPPQRLRAWKAPEKAGGAGPKKATPFQDFGRPATSLTSLTARLIGLSGGLLLLLQNGLDRITQADDSSDNSIELMMFGDFLRCPWPTYLLHLTLNHCWMTSPATPNHAVGFQLTRCWVLLSHSDWGSRYWIW